jgi:molybdopterin molybdotransferase
MKEKMISPERAEQLMRENLFSKKIIEIPLKKASGLILAQDIYADRPFPPYDKVAMDGIAISFEDWNKGQIDFKIEGVQYAGQAPIARRSESNCIEIMTGASLHSDFDTVVRYEDIEIKGVVARILTKNIFKNQNIQKKGKDAEQNERLIKKGTVISPAVIAVLASVGVSKPKVYSPPRVAVIATGDEIVEINATPKQYQIRASNTWAIQNILSSIHIKSQIAILNDDFDLLKGEVSRLIRNNDVLIFSGGVSMGKKDNLPEIFSQLGISEIFYKISQKPGKPFWFGNKGRKIIFALPGNPTAAFLCTVRYVKPWLSYNLQEKVYVEKKAFLVEECKIKSTLTNLIQVKVENIDGINHATPISGNGSGDFINLIKANAVLEIPPDLEGADFKDKPYRIWEF